MDHGLNWNMFCIPIELYIYKLSFNVLKVNSILHCLLS